MRIFIITADYPAYLEWSYSSNGVASKSYDELVQLRHETLFGLAGNYSSNLHQLGHEAWDVHANDEIMQGAWAREHGMEIVERSALQKYSKTVLRAVQPHIPKPLRQLKTSLRPLAMRMTGNSTYEILRRQVQHYKPDIILNQAMDVLPDAFMVEIKPYTRLIAGQIAAPLPQERTFRAYDLVFSSLPNYVKYFREQGLASELSRLAFEPSILSVLGPSNAHYAATFVGSLSTFHSGRIDLVEDLCQSATLDVWGEIFGALPKSSSITSHHHGPAWGINMFRILRDSKITINHHIGIAENYANNMRLYEATGVGTLLLTDAKDNLDEIFKVDREVVTYRTRAECADKIRYYLDHENERSVIAKAGQNRTLNEHTYLQRVRDIAELLNKHLCAA